MRIARRVLIVAAATAAMLAPAAAAQAAPAHCGTITQTTGSNYGLLNGTQIAVPVDLDLNLSHNALGLLGYASAAGDDYRGGCGGHHHRRHHRHHQG